MTAVCSAQPACALHRRHEGDPAGVAVHRYLPPIDVRPRVISGANSLWARGYGDPEPETVIVVGFERAYAESLFGTCQSAGVVTNSYGVRNEESSRHTGIYLCRDPVRPWPEMWAKMQWFQ